jgi:hypothetical protein
MTEVSHETTIKTCLEFVHPHVIAVWVMAGTLEVTWPLILTRVQLRVTDSGFIGGKAVKDKHGHVTVE